ncbi:MAG: hypothetical protein KC493_17335 [Bacteriovoracaceae bacterium]|nr:hypothetical protein [Bacteriovoracaceae bacterium]
MSQQQNELSRDIYHSLKNHIQTISCLLELYGNYSDSDSYRLGLETANSKFFVMAMVLRFFEKEKEQELQEVVRSLFENKAYEHEVTTFKANINSSFCFDVDYTLRLMIVLNEFTDHMLEIGGEEKIELEIEGSTLSNDSLELKISGIFSSKKESINGFRLELVNAFLKPLNASYEVEESDCGLTIRLVLEKI